MQGGLRRLWKAMRRRHQRNTVERAKRHAQHHYDLSTELYRLFLDDGLNYSCGFFRTPDESGRPGNQEIMLRVRYLDHVEKRDGEWKIAHRRVVFSPSQLLTVAEDYLAENVIQEGALDDPSYTWEAP